jgi:hypothetical protein
MAIPDGRWQHHLSGLPLRVIFYKASCPDGKNSQKSSKKFAI